jgi:hypothetical protein
MVYKEPRHKIFIFLIIATLFITIVSGWDYWKMWSVVPFSLVFLYITGNHSYLLIILLTLDLLFLNESSYLYEPDYNNWKDVNEPDY